MTVRHQILQAALLLLNTDRPSDVPEVTLRRSFPGEKITEPRMALFIGQDNLDEPRHPHDPLARHRMLIGVQCIAPTDDVSELDAITEPMLAWASKCIGIGNIGGLAHYGREVGTVWEPEFMDFYIQKATATYEISYQALRANPTLRN
jgi:hypothetical protein